MPRIDDGGWAESYASARAALERAGYWPLRTSEDPEGDQYIRRRAHNDIDRLEGAELVAVHLLASGLAGKPEESLAGFERAIQDWD